MPFNPNPSDEDRKRIEAMMKRAAGYDLDARVKSLMGSVPFVNGIVDIVNTGATQGRPADMIVFAITTYIMGFIDDEKMERVSGILLSDVFRDKEIDL